MNRKAKILLEVVIGLLVLGTVLTGSVLAGRPGRVPPVSEGGFSRR